MRKSVEYTLWVLILFIIALVAYQWRWLNSDNYSIPDHTTQQQKAILATIPKNNKKSLSHLESDHSQNAIINDTQKAISAIPSSIDNKITLRQLSGTLSFDRLTFEQSQEEDITSYQFNPDKPFRQPLRFIRVNLRDSDHNIIARTYANELGKYQFSVADDNQHYYLEVVSQLSINDNHGNRIFARVINQGNAYQERTTYRRLYHAVSNTFVLTESENTENLHLTTGWHSTLREFEPQHSQAQPFAILDTLSKGFIYLKQQKIPLTATQKMLTITWSQDPDIIEKSTGFYSPKKNLIYISGHNALDINSKPISTISEWNEHTILHEFGHYYLWQIIGRDDSQAGHHSAFGFGSLTLAFSEGVASALAKTILKNWHDRRVHYNIDKQQFAISQQAIINNQAQNKDHELTDSEGQVYQRPQFNFSPFIEQSISYFILSIIDPRSPYSARTTQLYELIGMHGLHQALKEISTQPALTTIYSLAHQLKQKNSYHALLIDELGQQLDLTFEDPWGNGQPVIESHIIGNQQLLAPQTQYPFYSTITPDKEIALAFDGALSSISAMRPGTLRYLSFSAPMTGVVQLVATDVKDENNQRHQFHFNIIDSGDVIAQSQHFTDHQVSAAVFNVQAGTTYIIRLFDDYYTTPSQLNIKQPITTKVQLSYRK